VLAVLRDGGSGPSAEAVMIAAPFQRDGEGLMMPAVDENERLRAGTLPDDVDEGVEPMEPVGTMDGTNRCSSVSEPRSGKKAIACSIGARD
jgi:hypothetical protein